LDGKHQGEKKSVANGNWRIEQKMCMTHDFQKDRLLLCFS